MRLREYFDDQERKIKQLEAENAALRQRVQELEALSREAFDALVWCGGSADFASEGKARMGWENVAVPVFDTGKELLTHDNTSRSVGAGGSVYPFGGRKTETHP